jgi:hypothetical protein
MRRASSNFVNFVSSTIKVGGVVLSLRKSNNQGKDLVLKKDSLLGIVTIVNPTGYNTPKGIRAIKADIIVDQDAQKAKLILDWQAEKTGNIGRPAKQTRPQNGL